VGVGVAVDSSGAAYVTGFTRSADFPTTAGADQTTPGGGDADAFVVKLTGRPRVSTGQATAVGVTGATLNGSVNPNGDQTTYHFEYGISTSYGSATADHAAGSDTSDHAESQTISGLTPAMTYHFRIVATNSAGTTDGADQVFTTSPLAPSATTLPASGVGQTSATLNATINPHATPTSYRFDYGPSAAYGNSTPTRAAAAGSSDQRVSATVSGLAPGTTYHFRVVATSAGGTTSGGDRTLTTARPASPPPPASPRPRGVDLALRLRAQPRHTTVGGRITYTLTITNRGPARATSLVIRDRLPAQVRLAFARPSRQGRCTGRRTVTCRFPQLRTGRHALVRIVVRARRAGRAHNTVHAGARQHDPHPANNTAHATTLVLSPPRFTG